MLHINKLHRDEATGIDFSGNRIYYGELFRDSAKGVLDYFINRFNSIGIKHIIYGRDASTKDDLVFTEPTLWINPYFIFTRSNEEFPIQNSFQKDGFRIYSFLSSSNLFKEEGMQLIKYENYIVGAYYPSRNLYVCVIDIIKRQARKRHFDCCFDLLFKNI
jgi:hypothetical protein